MSPALWWTHQRSTIRRTADKIYYMHEGALLPPETPSTIHDSTQEIYKNVLQRRTLGYKKS